MLVTDLVETCLYQFSCFLDWYVFYVMGWKTHSPWTVEKPL